MTTEQRYTFYSDDDRGRGKFCPIPWQFDQPCLRPHQVSTHIRHERVRGNDIYRDDLRNGWHVVPEGVRYVAVKGIVAGQMRKWAGNASEAQVFARSETVPLTFDRNDHPDCWCVIDLHDLGDKRQPTGANRPKDNVTIVMGDGFADESPRYKARRARRQDIPTTTWEDRETPTSMTPREQEHRWSPHPESLGRGHVCACGQTIETKDVWRWDFSFKVGACNVAFAAYRNEMQKPSTQHATYTAAAERLLGAKPQGPTDAEIVEAYEIVMRGEGMWPVHEGSKPLGLHVRPASGGVFYVKLEDCRAAWSRELKRKQAEVREAERQRVVCEGTLAVDY